MLIANAILAVMLAACDGAPALPVWQVSSFEEPAEIGNYNVTVRLGDEKADTVSHIKFEAERCASPLISLKAGEFLDYTWTYRVKGPIIKSDKSEPKLKVEVYVEGADGLEANPAGKNTRSPAVDVKPCDARVIYLIGDSTVTDQKGGIYASWGQALPMMVKPGWTVANYALSGRSLQRAKQEGTRGLILDNIKPNDFVLIQMGHNDQKRFARVKEGKEPSYLTLLNEYIDMLEAKGAKVVLVTPVERRRFEKDGSQGGKTLVEFRKWVMGTAELRGLPCIDLNEKSYVMMGKLGAEGSKKTQCYLAGKKDDTHHSLYGAYLNARIIADGLAKIDDVKDAIKDEYREYDYTNPLPDPGFPITSKINDQKPEGN